MTKDNLGNHKQLKRFIIVKFLHTVKQKAQIQPSYMFCQQHCYRQEARLSEDFSSLQKQRERVHK